MSWITVAFYKNRWGTTLTVEKPDGCGRRVSGMKMDGTNRQIAKFTVDAEKLIDDIRNECWESDE